MKSLGLINYGVGNIRSIYNMFNYLGLNIDIINDDTVKDDTLFVTIYAINYNILKVHSGMGGLLYKD